MTRTKSGFLKAGSIIAIVMAALLAMFGLISFASEKMVDRTLVVESVFEMKFDEVDVIENADGSITYKNPTTGERIESADVDDLVEVVKMVMATIGVFTISLAIASLVIAVLNLVSTGQQKQKQGLLLHNLF